MRNVLILLLILLLMPLEAQAYQASVVFNGCNEEQKTALRAALRQADRGLTELLQRLDAGELESYVKAWFGNNRPEDIRRRYQRIRSVLDRPRTLVLSCEERQCEHNLFGYAEGNSVSVCPEFFASSLNEGYDSQAGTLIHEFSHSHAETDDHAYGTGSARILAHEDPGKALYNADSYQYFFEAVTGENVQYADVGWSEDNSCEWAYDGECDHPRQGTGSCRLGTDSTDCANAAAQGDRQARKPSHGPRHPKDTCEKSLDGVCDASCAPDTDYTDCLTGTRRGK